MTYDEAVKMVRGKTNRKERKIGNNTYAYIEYDDSVSICLHGTAVVRFFPNGLVRLHSGGWRTSTTKNRINKYSPVKVYQRNYEWFVEVVGATGCKNLFPFVDKMLVSAA